jgi:hypothetical protein
MATAPADFSEDLYGIDFSQYVFVQCLMPGCRSVYRWGIYGFQEGAIHCPICGAVTWSPKLVDKMTYIHYMQKMGNLKNLGQVQRKLWDWRQNDEEYQRR